MYLRTSLADTMSCLFPWCLTTLVLCVVNTSVAPPSIPPSDGSDKYQDLGGLQQMSIVPPAHASTDDYMALVYICEEQLLSFMRRSPSSGGNNGEQVTTTLPHPMNMFPTMANFNTSREYTNIFLSALLWLNAVHPLWIYLHCQECLVPHRFCASNADSGTYLASDTIYVSVPCCSVITPEALHTRLSKEEESGAAITTGSTECL